MKPYFLSEADGEFFIIQKDEPHWVLHGYCFSTQQEIKDFHKKFHGSESYSKQIPGYCILIVIMNHLPKIKTVPYRHEKKIYLSKKAPYLDSLVSDFLQYDFNQNLQKYQQYKISR